MKITLVRHTSVDVPKGICYGASDVGLKETFPQEAASVREKLEARGIKFDAVFSSPLTRCLRLAGACGYTIPDDHKDKRLMEMNFGIFELMDYDDIYKDPRSKPFFEDSFNNSFPQGESFNQQMARVTDFLLDLKNGKLAPGAENVLIFAHGGVLLCAQLATGAIERDGAFQKLSPYGGIVEVTI